MVRWILFFVFLITLIGLGAIEVMEVNAESDSCPPLTAPTGLIVNVSTVSELVDAVNQAEPATTILVADGIYNLNGAYLRIDVPGVVLRSASGNRETVVLDGNYDTTEIIQIVASGVTVADLTLREAFYHPIHIMSSESLSTDSTILYNLHIIDPGEQAVKITPVMPELQRFFRNEQAMRVGEELLQEKQDKVPGKVIIMRVHCQFTEKVFITRIINNYGPKPIPYIIKRIHPLPQVERWLVIRLDKGPAQFYSPGKVFPDEFL